MVSSEATPLPGLGPLSPSESSGGSSVLALGHHVLEASVLKGFTPGREAPWCPHSIS